MHLVKPPKSNCFAQAYKKKEWNIYWLRSRGGTEIGQKIRKILLDPKNTALCPKSELLLYLADRVQHLDEVIVPSLSNNKLVICDRYHDATVAYQGGGRNIHLGWFASLVDELIIKPDLTFFFDISPELSQQRLAKRNEELGVELCRMESEGLSFFERVRAKYKEIAVNEPQRVKVIDASKDIQTIQKELATHLLQIL